MRKMSIKERTLEEDEVKIDNLLHKIVESNNRIEMLTQQIRDKTREGYILKRVRMISILTDTIFNLSTLADEIDVRDEKLVKDMEAGVQTQLQDAIGNIERATELLQKDA